MGNKNSGPRPKPTALKLLRGVTRADCVNVHEPQPPPGAVTKPVTLSVGAGRMWDEWAPLCIQMGTLTAGDVRPFAMLCELQATVNRAAALKDKPGKLPRPDAGEAIRLPPAAVLRALRHGPDLAAADSRGDE